MRPVERGNIPVDKNGNPISFKVHGDTRDYLIERLGDYCSYCESPLLSPDVEHIQPKISVPELTLAWTNFLLACIYCNRIKNKKTINSNNLHDYFWADIDNTFRAFIYELDLPPQISPHLNLQQRKAAQNTLELTGLDRDNFHKKCTEKDRRWIKRKEAWDDALSVKEDLINNPSEEMQKTIIRLAKAKGFWSVWMTVFQDDMDMRHRLINAFKGTSQTCFDANTQPIHRAGGQI
jgi:uncharacterized protein (TIGR02646 family)